MVIAQLIVWLVAAYLGAGLLFAAAFARRGAGVLVAAAHRASWGFRVMILPASVALWPGLALRWVRAAQVTRRSGSGA